MCTSNDQNEEKKNLSIILTNVIDVCGGGGYGAGGGGVKTIDFFAKTKKKPGWLFHTHN